MKLYFVILLVLGLQGCVAYPEVAWNRADYQRCNLFTRELELEVKSFSHNGKVSFRTADELISFLVVSGFVFTTTAVISGSIVIVGNTVHFLEKQGRCDDSMLNETVMRAIEKREKIVEKELQSYEERTNKELEEITNKKEKEISN